jgi:hypothetical protein
VPETVKKPIISDLIDARLKASVERLDRNGQTVMQIARELRITTGAVRRALGRTGRGGPRKDRLFHPKLTADQVRELRRRYDAGERVVDIAKVIGCSIASVTHIGSRQTRLDVV